MRMRVTVLNEFPRYNNTRRIDIFDALRTIYDKASVRETDVRPILVGLCYMKAMSRLPREVSPYTRQIRLLLLHYAVLGAVQEPSKISTYIEGFDFVASRFMAGPQCFC